MRAFCKVRRALSTDDVKRNRARCRCAFVRRRSAHGAYEYDTVFSVFLAQEIRATKCAQTTTSGVDKRVEFGDLLCITKYGRKRWSQTSYGRVRLRSACSPRARPWRCVRRTQVSRYD